MREIHCIMAVWGETYLRQFLELSLPSQLSAANLPALAGRYDASYSIYTDSAGASSIKEHAGFQALSRLMPVRFIVDDAQISDDKFNPLMAFHNRSIRTASESDAALLFLAPDFVLADGVVARIAEVHAAGKRAVFTLTPRLKAEDAARDLAKFHDAASGALTISPREMAGVVMSHLHPIERSYTWGPAFSSFPIHAYWPVGEEGFLARCFYLHPIFVDPMQRGEFPAITIDADFVERACPDMDDVHVVRDSDELLCVELSRAAAGDANAVGKPWGAKAWPYARWACVHANPKYDSVLHHWLFQHEIRIHSGEMKRKWRSRSRKSSRVARMVRFYMMLIRNRKSLADMAAYWRDTAVSRD